MATSNPVPDVVEKAAKERMSGDKPGRLRSLLAAAAAGAAAGIFAYRMLRSEPGGDQQQARPRRRAPRREHDRPRREHDRPRREPARGRG
jgi:hypothetical protein